MSCRHKILAVCEWSFLKEMGVTQAIHIIYGIVAITEKERNRCHFGGMYMLQKGDVLVHASLKGYTSIISLQTISSIQRPNSVLNK